MKISFLSVIDFANVLTEYSYCLNKHSKDIESKSICFQKHPFNYNIQHDYDIEKCNADQILKSKQFLLESDIIIFAEESWEGQQPHLVLFMGLIYLKLMQSFVFGILDHVIEKFILFTIITLKEKKYINIFMG